MESGGRSFASALVFAAVFIVLAAASIIFPYEYRDSDSSAYHSISVRLAGRPLSEWTHPEWWGHGGNSGLFRDHPPGIFWLPAVFVRLGVPGRAAPLCANFLYLLLLLFFLHGLVRNFADRETAWATIFAFVLTPICIQYLMRANHELPLALAVTAALYALARCRESRRWAVLYAAALLLAVFIKGVSALVVTFSSAAFWFVSGRSRRTVLVVAFGHLLALALVLGFEGLYGRQTGESFLSFYLGFQGGKAVEAGFHPLVKLYNVVWYLARILWFAAPWVIILLWIIIRSARRPSGILGEVFIRLALLSSGVTVLFFSLFDRKADRYIFSAYVLCAAAGAVALARWKPSWKKFFSGPPLRPALVLGALLVVLTLVRIYFHTYHYRFIRLWAQ